MELAYHIMRGDQLIVRGSDVSTIMSVLNILKVQRPPLQWSPVKVNTVEAKFLLKQTLLMVPAEAQ